jgi:hypothetical protein
MTTPKGSKGKGKAEERRMMHFRTLDWGMEPLRSVLVVLEFVRTKSEEPERVIGRTITYAGYVGVLTGVRYVRFCSRGRPCAYMSQGRALSLAELQAES